MHTHIYISIKFISIPEFFWLSPYIWHLRQMCHSPPPNLGPAGGARGSGWHKASTWSMAATVSRPWHGPCTQGDTASESQPVPASGPSQSKVNGSAGDCDFGVTYNQPWGPCVSCRLSPVLAW